MPCCALTSAAVRRTIDSSVGGMVFTRALRIKWACSVDDPLACASHDTGSPDWVRLALSDPLGVVTCSFTWAIWAPWSAHCRFKAARVDASQSAGAKGLSAPSEPVALSQPKHASASAYRA